MCYLRNPPQWSDHPPPPNPSTRSIRGLAPVFVPVFLMPHHVHDTALAEPACRTAQGNPGDRQPYHGGRSQLPLRGPELKAEYCDNWHHIVEQPAWNSWLLSGVRATPEGKLESDLPA